MQSLGYLGIRDLFNPALDLGDPYRASRRITHVAGEQIHEVVDPACCRFQLVTINTVYLEVHERIASLRKARTKRTEVSSNLRLLYASQACIDCHKLRPEFRPRVIVLASD